MTRAASRRFDHLDLIRRGAALLADDPDPVREAAGDWLRDVALNFSDIGPTEVRFAVTVGRAAVIQAHGPIDSTTTPAPTTTPPPTPKDPMCPTSTT